jgi:hypothetical protein
LPRWDKPFDRGLTGKPLTGGAHGGEDDRRDCEAEVGARIHDREASPLFQDSTGQSEKKHLSSMLHNG